MTDVDGGMLSRFPTAIMSSMSWKRRKTEDAGQDGAEEYEVNPDIDSFVGIDEDSEQEIPKTTDEKQLDMEGIETEEHAEWDIPKDEDEYHNEAEICDEVGHKNIIESTQRYNAIVESVQSFHKEFQERVNKMAESILEKTQQYFNETIEELGNQDDSIKKIVEENNINLASLSQTQQYVSRMLPSISGIHPNIARLAEENNNEED